MEVHWICLAISIGIVVPAFVVCEVRRRRRALQYLETHPPISDEEFLRRCSAEVRPEVALKVRRIIHQIYGIEYERISPEMNLIELEDIT